MMMYIKCKWCIHTFTPFSLLPRACMSLTNTSFCLYSFLWYILKNKKPTFSKSSERTTPDNINTKEASEPQMCFLCIFCSIDSQDKSLTYSTLLLLFEKHTHLLCCWALDELHMLWIFYTLERNSFNVTVSGHFSYITTVCRYIYTHRCVHYAYIHGWRNYF